MIYFNNILANCYCVFCVSAPQLISTSAPGGGGGKPVLARLISQGGTGSSAQQLITLPGGQRAVVTSALQQPGGQRAVVASAQQQPGGQRSVVTSAQQQAYRLQQQQGMSVMRGVAGASDVSCTPLGNTKSPVSA